MIACDHPSSNTACEESLRALARRHGVNQKTVAKWKKRTSAADLPTGPKDPGSTSLTIEEEAVVVAFRRHTLLPLDGRSHAITPLSAPAHHPAPDAIVARTTASSATASAACPRWKATRPAKRKFKPYPIGLGGANRVTASAFLEALVAAVPYKIHTVLTDTDRRGLIRGINPKGGIQFTFPPRYADGPTARYITRMFDIRCEENGIEHRLTKVKHPWSNGQSLPRRRPGSSG